MTVNKDCEDCEGKGYVIIPPKKMISGWSSERKSQCTTCKGKKVTVTYVSCETCDGAGKIDDPDTEENEKNSPAALAAGKIVALIWDSDKGSNTITIGESNYPDVQLVITNKDVVVARDYKGLILTDGKISFYKGSTSDKNLVIESDPDAVRNILTYGYKEDPDDEESKMLTIAVTFHDGKQYIYSSKDDDLANLSLGNMITYENWKKD